MSRAWRYATRAGRTRDDRNAHPARQFERNSIRVACARIDYDAWTNATVGPRPAERGEGKGEGPRLAGRGAVFRSGCGRADDERQHQTGQQHGGYARSDCACPPASGPPSSPPAPARVTANLVPPFRAQLGSIFANALSSRELCSLAHSSGRPCLALPHPSPGSKMPRLHRRHSSRLLTAAIASRLRLRHRQPIRLRVSWPAARCRPRPRPAPPPKATDADDELRRLGHRRRVQRQRGAAHAVETRATSLPSVPKQEQRAATSAGTSSSRIDSAPG